MKYLPLIVLFFALQSACKKDVEAPTYETIKPGDYYPIFPGSYWKYLQNDTDTVIYTSSSNYILNSFLVSHYPDKYSTPVYVPYLNNQPIYGYSRVEHIPPPFGDYYQLWTILTENIGDSFIRKWYDPRLQQQGEVVIVFDKIVNANMDSVLILKESQLYLGTRIDEYTKNVGLSRSIIINPITTDTISKLVLFDYFINN